MNEIQTWPQVVAELKKHLASRDYPTRLYWIFRDDILELGEPPRVFYRIPDSDNAALAERVFNRGRRYGYARVVAVARFGNATAATVWYPELSVDDPSGWNKGTWIKIRHPLPRGVCVPRLPWKLLRWTPTYRSYQRDGWTIGTRQWASQREK